MVHERVMRRVFWSSVRAGASVEAAAAASGLPATTGGSWFRQRGGVIPQQLLEPDPPTSRFLTMAERTVIQLGRARGMSMRAIGREIGRPASTVSRELKRSYGIDRVRYTAHRAQLQAERTRRRPKPRKLAADPLLWTVVQSGLTRRWSPEQISRWLRGRFPHHGRMQISPETIYQTLYLLPRGQLTVEVKKALRSGQALRRPRRQPGQRAPRIAGMVNIADRPAEVADRAVPGHWEGDLIIGAGSKSQIGTLVERTSRAVILVHLPGARTAEVVADALIQTLNTVPKQVRRSVTWDQGSELASHARITMATGAQVYFCDPHAPWQRGSNENTNGLLRQYFPKGTDLSVHDSAHLAYVADELNNRPRKSLDWRTPAEVLVQLLASPQPDGVASTT